MTDFDTIRAPEHLRPGDIMFGPITGPVGLGVGLGQLLLRDGFRIGGLAVRHVAIVSREASAGQPVRLVQAMPAGAEEVDLDPREHWTARYAYVRLPEVYSGQGEDAASLARLMVQERVRYSFLSYLSLAAWCGGLRVRPLERWIGRRQAVSVTFVPKGGLVVVRLPREAICSVLVDQAWTLVGQSVMTGVAHQCVTPGAMAGQLWCRPGAIWASPIRESAAISWQIKPVS